MRILLGLVFVLVFLVSAQAQQVKAPLKLSGKITAIRDSTGISYAHIIDLSNPSGVICDQNGNFAINCMQGDTLLISAVGYENYKFSTHDLDPVRPITNLRIRLMTKIFLLPSVTILPFHTREGMKRYFVNMTLPDKDKEEIEKAKLHINRAEEIGAVPQSGLTLPGPATLLWDLFSREAKNRRKLEKLIAQDNIDKQIAKRYNPEVVSLIIGQDDTNLIHDFMDYCHITLGYLATVNDYDLYLFIKNSWQNYAKERNIK